MNSLFAVLLVQVILGAFDNLWHHEITEKLPSKPSARHELTMHAIRELLYGVIFFGLAWYAWHGAWAYVLVGLLMIELLVTLIDFVIEDKTRILPPFERVLHTILAINIGVFFAVLFPIVKEWAVMPSGLIDVDYGLWSWAFTVFAFFVFLWGIRDVIAVMNLHILKVPEWQRKPVKKGFNDDPKNYLVTGGTGLIGSELVREYIKAGHNVTVLSRDIENVAYKFGPNVRAINNLDQIHSHEKIDCIVNLAGEPLAGGFWTKERKAKFLSSRLDTTNAVLSLINRLIHKPDQLVNASAIGYYGNRGNEKLSERDKPVSDFMSDLCAEWERLALKAEDYGINVVRLRIGLVLAKQGGILAPLVLSTKLGGAMIMGNGRQWMSWISLSDLIRMILFLNQNNESGVFNATAPNPIDQREFAKSLAEFFKRPLFLRMPAKLLRLAIRDMADLFLNGQRVMPQRIMDKGFEFKHEIFSEALDAIYMNENDAVKKGSIKTFYNDECPVCNTEIEHYKKMLNRPRFNSSFIALKKYNNELASYGLNEYDITRRLYTVDNNGKLFSGVDAFIRIWSSYPKLKWLARIIKLRIIKWFASFVYEGLCVPILAAYNGRRQSQKIPKGHYHES